VGYRVQGLLVKARPDAAGLSALEGAYGYRLFELSGRGLWLIDLGIPEPQPGDRAMIRAARPLAPGYVDALRVLGDDDVTLEQLAWLAAAGAASRQLRQPVLGFLSDDAQLDFAALVKPEGAEVIGDKLGQYLLRWEGGSLAIQPFCSDGNGQECPTPPEELSLIPSVTLLANEKLAPGGYPLHGNVMAEIHSFAEGAAGLGIGTWNFGPVGSLKMIAAAGLDHSLWDRAAGESGTRGR
jgi:hypothetical protein